MASLLDAQSDLLEMVENTESRVQNQALLALTAQLEEEIGDRALWRNYHQLFCRYLVPAVT
ncbi:hypothetical protein OH492_17495 [Vibrio chagasii]|nr:hypothetical protein [Vibrio chagasii]